MVFETSEAKWTCGLKFVTNLRGKWRSETQVECRSASFFMLEPVYPNLSTGLNVGPCIFHEFILGFNGIIDVGARNS